MQVQKGKIQDKALHHKLYSIQPTAYKRQVVTVSLSSGNGEPVKGLEDSG